MRNQRGLTVIVPAYNCEATLEETVRSVFEGNDSVVEELVLVDDESRDGTSALIAALSARYPKIVALRHERNRGGAAARNTAVAAASCAWVFCLDSDNVLEAGSLAPLLQFAEQSGADVAAFRELRYFQRSTRSITHLWRFPPGVFGLRDCLAGTVVPGASGNYLFRRSAWEDVGGYREGSKALDSWVFGLDLLAHGKRMHVMEQGCYFHRYGVESYWVRESRAGSASLLASSLMERYLDRLESESRARVLEHPEIWFDRLDDRPLKLKGEPYGRAGTLVNVSLARRLRSLFR